MKYDSGSVLRKAIFSPRETSPEVVTQGRIKNTLRPTNPESIIDHFESIIRREQVRGGEERKLAQEQAPQEATP